MAENDLDTTRERIIDAAGQIVCRAGIRVDHGPRHLPGGRGECRGRELLLPRQGAALRRGGRAGPSLATRPGAAARTGTTSTPPREKLADFIDTFFRRVLGGPDDTWRTKLVMREIMQPSSACAEIAQSNIRPQFEILHSILREILPANVSDEERHLIGFSIVGQCLFYHVAGPIIRNLIDEQRVLDLRRRPSWRST